MHYRITNNKFDRFKKDFNNLVEYYRRDYAVESKKYIGKRAYVIILKK